MWEILRDPIWQFIGAVLALAAILVAVTLYLKQRRHKSLSYEIISSTPLLSLKDEIKGKLQILYEGKPIQQVHLIVARIINSGNTPIVLADYERPVSLSFGKEAQVLTAEVTKTSPDSLQASIKIEEKNVVLMPTLLNQGDWVVLKMLVTKFGGEIAVDGRIVGIREIRDLKETPLRFFVLALSGFVLVIIGFAGTTLSTYSPTFWFSLIMLGYFFALAALLSDPNYRKRFRKALRTLLRRTTVTITVED